MQDADNIEVLFHQKAKEAFFRHYQHFEMELNLQRPQLPQERMKDLEDRSLTYFGAELAQIATSLLREGVSPQQFNHFSYALQGLCNNYLNEMKRKFTSL